MAKPISKREELNIGSNGLRINNLLTQKLKSPFDGVELSLEEVNNHQYQLPVNWSSQARQSATAFFYPEEITGDEEQPQNETSITQVINRVAEAWRWWGDSYSYFNRKTDAQNFSNELKYILLNRIASPNLSMWQTLGIRQTYGIRGEATPESYFIDYDTENIYPVRDSYTHPQILPKFDGNLTADFYLDSTHPIWQDEHLAAHVVRMITIAQDICILMSGYPSKESAEKSLTNRHISIGLVPEIKSVQDRVLVEAITTSAELASVISGNSDAETKAEKSLTKIEGLKSEIQTATSLIKRSGVRNYISLANHAKEIYDYLLNPIAEIPVEEPKIEQHVPTQKPSEGKPIPQANSEFKLNSVTTEFSIGDMSGYLVLIPEAHQLIIHSNRPELVDNNSMKVFTKILGLYLRNHLEVHELEEIAGLSPDANISNLQRYIITWLQSLKS